MRIPRKLLITCLFLLTGCSMKVEPPQELPANPNPTAAQVPPLHGTIHGGQQPLYNSHLYMFQISTAGYGQPSISLLQGGAGTTTTQDTNSADPTYLDYYVTTDQYGNFDITNADYSSCTPGQQVYLYSVGGSPGITNDANAGAGLLAVLGDCGNFSSKLPATIQVNEVSTIAAAYALAGFAVDATHIASSNTSAAVTAVANAALTAWSLGSISTGQALASTPWNQGADSVPQSEINTLADILAACINSTDSSYPNQNSSACGTLFSDATANGTPSGTQPTDTATAAINIAHNPGANVGALFGLAYPTDPFQPKLPPTPAPNDWTIAITYFYTINNGSSPDTDSVAIDASGNVWVTGEFQYLLSREGVLSELTGYGSHTADFTGNDLNDPIGVAIDLSGNAWVADNSSSEVSVFTSDGNSAFSSNGLNSPVNLAVDASGNVWVTNTSNYVSAFTSSGGVFSSSPFDVSGTSNQYAGPAAVSVDGSNNVWIANVQNGVSEFPHTGGGPVNFAGGHTNNPQFSAIDASGNFWIANDESYGLSEFANNGTPVTSMAAYTSSDLSNPYGIEFDGLNHLWATTESRGGGVVEFNTSGSEISPTVYAAGIGGSTGIAIDGSGNIWLADSAGAGPLVELVGVAAPLLNPLSYAASINMVATRP